MEKILPLEVRARQNESPAETWTTFSCDMELTLVGFLHLAVSQVRSSPEVVAAMLKRLPQARLLRFPEERKGCFMNGPLVLIVQEEAEGSTSLSGSRSNLVGPMTKRPSSASTAVFEERGEENKVRYIGSGVVL
jgi:hypothetical protein